MTEKPRTVKVAGFLFSSGPCASILERAVARRLTFPPEDADHLAKALHASVSALGRIVV